MSDVFPYQRFYLAAWATVLGFSSVVLNPEWKGTVPAYLFAIFSLPFAFFPLTRSTMGYLWTGFIFLIIWTASLFLSQGSLYVGDVRDYGDLLLVQRGDTAFYFRRSIFTQSAYLFAAFLIFMFVRYFWHPRLMKFFWGGIWVLLLYGYYEWFGFQVTGQNMDFLSNRVFGTEDAPVLGSLFQLYEVAGHAFMRFKSLTGEPSMYALTVLPCTALAFYEKKRFLAPLLALSLVLTVSTTAFLGLAIFAVVYSIQRRFFLILCIVTGLVSAACLVYFRDEALGMWDMVIANKFSAEGTSGSERMESLLNALDYFWQSSIPVKLFGLGFGTVRELGLFHTLLINIGLVGLSVFTFFFLKPVFQLGNSHQEKGLKIGLCVMLLALFISVPEYAYPTNWFFAGLAYYWVDLRRRERAKKQFPPNENPDRTSS